MQKFSLFPILGLALLTIGFIAFANVQGHKTWLISPESAKAYALKLTRQEVHGVPVIVLTSDGCPACVVLERELKSHKISYIRADVDRSVAAGEIQNRIGNVTPTIIVGTRVMRGGNANVIIRELAGQHLNREFQ
jgi:glutaredoxin